MYYCIQYVKHLRQAWYYSSAFTMATQSGFFFSAYSAAFYMLMLVVVCVTCVIKKVCSFVAFTPEKTLLFQPFLIIFLLFVSAHNFFFLFFQSSLLCLGLFISSCPLSLTYFSSFSFSLSLIFPFPITVFFLSSSVSLFFLLYPLLPSFPVQPQLLERLLEEIQNLKATVLSQEKRICDLENKLSQYTNGTDWCAYKHIFWRIGLNFIETYFPHTDKEPLSHIL